MFESSNNTLRRPNEFHNSNPEKAVVKPIINMLDYFPAAKFEVFTSCEDQYDKITRPLIYEHDFLFLRADIVPNSHYTWSRRVLAIDVLNREILALPGLTGKRQRSQPKIIIDAIARYSHALKTALSQAMKKLTLARPKI